jgi:hypothetical protein
MDLICAKLGEKYLIGYDEHGVLYYTDAIINGKKRKHLEGTVVGIYATASASRRELLLAWTSSSYPDMTQGMSFGSSLMNRHSPQHTTFISTNYDRGLWLTQYWVVGKPNYAEVVATITELPCATCKRKNYSTAKACWWCARKL